MPLPPPSRLANLSNFPAWYEGQDELFSQVMDWMASGRRFLGVEAPTGSGKSLVAMLTTKLSGSHAMILTATKGLQTQLLSDFADHLADVRGQNAYRCLEFPASFYKVDQAPCHSGYQCAKKLNGCSYFDAVRTARLSPIVITNYAMWLTQQTYTEGLGRRDLLICDEFHEAFSALESFMQVELRPHHFELLGPPAPEPGFTWTQWARWAAKAMSRCSLLKAQKAKEVFEVIEAGETPDPKDVRTLATLRALDSKLTTLCSAQDGWAVEQQHEGFTFSPVWPARYSRLLFGSVPKIMLMSACLTPKTMDLLGVPEAERDTISAPSYFPPRNTPVTHVPTIRVNHRSTPADEKHWVNRIDQIISRRLDRKGIIFTVSYARRTLLLQYSQHAGILHTHGRDDVIQQVKKFREADPPAILVSPAVTSGWDFPYVDYIIIGKVPYPDTRGVVVKARHEEDDDWTSFTAMQTLVQEAGRGTRSAVDKCEVLVIDDNWKWFWGKYRHFAPEWFKGRVNGSVTTIPDPIGLD